jgi:hypothetical protein
VISLVGGVVLVSRARLARPSPGRLLAALLLVALACWLAFAQAPRLWRMQVSTGVVVAAGIVLTWWLLRGTRPVGRILPRAGAVAVVVGTWSLLLLAVQHHHFPKPTPADWGMPAATSAYRTQLPAAVGDVMVVGTPDRPEPRRGAAPSTLVANSWYLNPHPVANVYTMAAFRGFKRTYCMDYRGFTCAGALGTLVSDEPVTGVPRVDLLSVSTLQLLKSTLPAARTSAPPPGWRVADEDDVAVTWVRDDPVDSAGGVVWASPGTVVAELSGDALGVRLRVDEVPPGGGRLVLSRLDWPGYRVSAGAVEEPVEDYLLTVSIPSSSAAGVVEIDYRPPRWRLLVGSWVLALAISVIWTGAEAARALARRRRRGVPATWSAADHTEQEPS